MSSAYKASSSDAKKRNKSTQLATETVQNAESTVLQEKPKDAVSATTRSCGTCHLKWIIPLVLTAVSFYVRFSRIDINKNVVWDEAHFGKFGSYYIKHEFYHDVHPPLGKMLIGLSEYLAGFDGQFGFESGAAYPEGVNFGFMRRFNATFSALCVPVCWFTALDMGFSMWTSLLVTIMVCLEHSYIALGKFILLDSMLLFFTLTTFHCMLRIHVLRREQFSKKWLMWMALLGINVGCVCSVKWVGLFVTVVVGLYTVVDLYFHHINKKMTWTRYSQHWLIRIFSLIVLPFAIYLLCFKIHFALLYKSGTGDHATNSLFQVNLEGNKVQPSPRNITIDSRITMRSHGLSPNLLHSHIQRYPEGSEQQQITGYGHSDSNNDWIIRPARNYHKAIDFVGDGDVIRLQHFGTKVNLHSHEIPAIISSAHWEVSGYGNDEVGDEKDNWIVEIVEQLDSPTHKGEAANLIHPLSTSFRLKNQVLGCYLATTGVSYPTWGFSQSEIVCKESWSSRDKATWWNVEDHSNENLEIAEDYIPPKSKFWEDFVTINFAMAASNNALVPDSDKYDSLASDAWEWPTLHVGLRMCGWGQNAKYFLIGSPFNTWLSTAALVITLLVVLPVLAIRWQRQCVDLTEDQMWYIAIGFVFPFFAWVLHYLPFVVMGRVTYVHHYVPALYFAILIFGFLVDYFLAKSHAAIKYPSYTALLAAAVWVYWYFSPVCQGMEGPNFEFNYLNILSTWTI